MKKEKIKKMLSKKFIFDLEKQLEIKELIKRYKNEKIKRMGKE
jgi:hypothetical protein